MPQVDLNQTETFPADRILAELDAGWFSARRAATLTSIVVADSSRIRKAYWGRLKLDRPMKVPAALGGPRVTLDVEARRGGEPWYVPPDLDCLQAIEQGKL